MNTRYLIRRAAITAAALACVAVGGWGMRGQPSEPRPAPVPPTDPSAPRLPTVPRVPPVVRPPGEVRPPAEAERPRVDDRAGPHTLVDRERLMATVRALPTKRAAFSDKAHAEGLMETERLLVERLKELGYTPELERVPWFGEREEGAPVYHNVIVEHEGKVRPREVIIVGAHFDAVPNSPGADDNGTGTAALLEMARVLRDFPTERTIRMIFFNLEEVGLVGSRVNATALGERLQRGEEQVIGMISMDMLGYFTDEPNSQRWPEIRIPGITLPTTGDFITVGGLVGNRVFSQPLIEGMKASAPGLKIFEGDVIPFPMPDFMRSDHAPYLGLGIPAVLITDTANFRSRHYHKPTDTVETLDPERFTLTARAITGAVWRMAEPMAGGERKTPPAPFRVPPEELLPRDQVPPSPRPATPPGERRPGGGRETGEDGKNRPEPR